MSVGEAFAACSGEIVRASARQNDAPGAWAAVGVPPTRGFTGSLRYGGTEVVAR